jgi:hypothetical protein
MTEPYSSIPETQQHARRVGDLINELVGQMIHRGNVHDASKTREPELSTFDRVTPQLRTLTYGSDEYKASLAEMGPALEHHYAVNRHHPEHFGERGIAGMTLVDVVEMLADWKAATERHADGNLERSLKLQKDRFGIEPQLLAILHNTAAEYGWL